MEIIEILQETINMVISIRTLDNSTYKGTIVEIDDYMNVILKNVDVFTESVTFCPKIVLRGSMIKYFILPPMLKYL